VKESKIVIEINAFVKTFMSMRKVWGNI